MKPLGDRSLRWLINCEFFVLLVYINEVNRKCELGRRELEGNRSLLLCNTFYQLKISPQTQTVISPSLDPCEGKLLHVSMCIFLVSQLYRRVKNTRSMKASLMSLKRVGLSKKEPMTTPEGRG